MRNLAQNCNFSKYCRFKNSSLRIFLILSFVSFLFFFPNPASASTVNELVTQINAYSGTHNGSLDVQANGNTITVTGSVTAAPQDGLPLYLDNNVTVEWGAKISVYEPRSTNNVLAIKQGGTFKLMPGAEIINTSSSSGSALDIDDPVVLYLNGGVIRGYVALDFEQYTGPAFVNGDVIIYTQYPATHDPVIITQYLGANPKAIIFVGNDGRVYGDVVLTQDLTMSAGQTLTIPNGESLTITAGRTLTIPAGATLNNQGTIINDGDIVVNGTLTGNTVGGNGDIVYNNNGGLGAQSSGEESAGSMGCNAGGLWSAGFVVLLLGVMGKTRGRATRL
jgi:hypothetical protein